MYIPRAFDPKSVSIVIPVKDNQRGIDNFLRKIFSLLPDNDLPLEIIIVDDGSYVPVCISNCLCTKGVPVKLTRSDVSKGRAGARNFGLSIATGKWILFVDSDCIPTATLISGYRNAYSDKCVGYAGSIQPLGTDPLSLCYKSWKMFIPPQIKPGVPMYLITANALVLKEALDRIGQFNETFFSAEDIDLGLRLSSVGKLAYGLGSLVHHDFSDGFLGFLERWKRYGSGEALLMKVYSKQRPYEVSIFEPTLDWLHDDQPFHEVMGVTRYLCYYWGYKNCTVPKLYDLANIKKFSHIANHRISIIYLFNKIISEFWHNIKKKISGIRGNRLKELYSFTLFLLSIFDRVCPGVQAQFIPDLIKIRENLNNDEPPFNPWIGIHLL